MLKSGKVIATGLDDGSVYVWDVQDGRQIRRVMLSSAPQGPISCLNWIGEDPSATPSDLVMVCTIPLELIRKGLDVDFDPAQYLPRVKGIVRRHHSFGTF